MRILQVTHYMPPHTGGIESVADALFRGLRARGHSVRWFASSSPEAPGTIDDLVRGQALDLLERRIGLPYPVFTPAALADLASSVREADVVVAHDCLYMSSFVALLTARRLSKPSLLIQHVGYVPYGPALDRVQRLAYRTVGRASLGLATRRVAVSPHVPEFFRSIGIDADVGVVANGIDDARFRLATPQRRAEARRWLGLPENQKVVLFVGRLVAKKGIDRVVRAFEPLSSSGALLAVAGDGPMATVLDRPFVRHLGRVPAERMQDVYAAADVLVLPSRGEGFPLTVQEARMTGLPVVVSDDPSFQANLEPSADCILARSDAEITDGLRRSLAAACDAGRIASEARERWGLQAFVHRYETMLMDLVRTRTTPRP